MTEKDKSVQGFGRTGPPSAGRVRPDVLRIKDIIPGAPGAGVNEGDQRVDIPRFDLAQDIMAEQRRLTAIRRKGPGGLERPSSPVSRLSLTEPRLTIDDGRWASADWDPIIADIVAKDIERLCGGAYI